MFKNLRRNSKQLFEPRRKSLATVASLSESLPDTTRTRTLTFFDLPAEIRNAVYENVAREVKIVVLPLSSKKHNKSPPPVPSLLLVSGRTRREYMPMLLEFAPIAFLVKDFEFKHLMRIISSFYSTELKALRNNPQLSIRLRVEASTKTSMASLRKWLVSRSDSLDRLPWHYNLTWKKNHQILPTSTQVHKINTYLNRRTLLHQNLEAMAQLHKNVDEALQFELDQIIAVFETELASVGVDPHMPWRDDSALMIYGVRMRGTSLW